MADGRDVVVIFTFLEGEAADDTLAQEDAKRADASKTPCKAFLNLINPPPRPY
jgi:hypothetical protein